MKNVSRNTRVESLEARRMLAAYYVSPAGSDAANGLSTATAWRTVTPVNAKDFNAGDQVLFQGGMTFNGTAHFGAEDAGTPASPVTIGSYGTGRATILGGNTDAIRIDNAAGFDIGNLRLVGNGTRNTSIDSSPAGVNFYIDLAGNVKKDYIRIHDIEATGFWEAGVFIEHHNGSTGYNDIEVRDSVFQGNGKTGLFVYGGNFDASTNVRVLDCQAYNNTGVTGLRNNSGSGIILSSVKGGLIDGCVAYHNGTVGHGGVGIWAYNADSIVIQHSESYDNQTTSNADGGGFDLDGGCTNSVIQYCYSHDNEGSGYGVFQFRGARNWNNNTVRYNVSQNDARANNAGGISLWDGGSGIINAEIYGNTVYLDNNVQTGATPQGIIFATKTTNVHVRNNIFMTRGGVELIDVARGQRGIVFQGNAYWSDGAAISFKWSRTSYVSFTAFQNATAQEKLNGVNVGYYGNPQLVNAGGGTTGNASAYTLLSNSPLRDRGVNLWSMGINPGSADFFGDPLPGPTGSFDIGADEIVS